MITNFDGWLGLLVDLSLKAALLTIVVAVGLRVVRLRNSNLQHRVWTAVLLAMLAMPLLVVVTPKMKVSPRFYPPLQRAPSQASTPADTSATPGVAATAEVQKVATIESPAQPAVVVVATQADTFKSPSVVHSTNNSVALRWPIVLLGIYILGVLVFGIRLLVAVVQARKLIATGRPIALPPSVAQFAGRTRMQESPIVRVPLTVGLRRPSILLPREWESWSTSMLSAVLAHEAAHVRRGDHWVTMLAEWNRVLYWFHPASWYVRQRLATLAEAACDDAVIESVGDRTAYARHLLCVAGKLSYGPFRLRRWQPACMAMARTPRVERRIDAILDSSRPLARRLGVAGVVLLLTVVAPLVLVVASLRADERKPAPPVVAANEGKQEGSVAHPAPKTNSKTAERTFVLTVLDDHDKPVPGAHLRVRMSEAGKLAKSTPRDCDESGQVRIDLPSGELRFLGITVETPGFAPFYATWGPPISADPIPEAYTVRLSDGRQVGGVIQDEDGKPIAGAKVSQMFQLKMRPENTSPISSGATSTTDSEGRWTYSSFPAGESQLVVSLQHPEFMQASVTEPASEFLLAKDGTPSRVMVMRRGIVMTGRVVDDNGQPLAGVQIVDRPAHGRGRPTAKSDQDGNYRIPNGTEGNGFLVASADGWALAARPVRIEPNMSSVDFQMKRGQPLRVRVVDKDGAPIEGVRVSLWTWDGNEIFGSASGSHGETDAEGVYVWANAPAGDTRYEISKNGYASALNQPLTPGEKENVITLSPLTTAETRLRSASGRVVDSKTQKPIARFRITPGERRSNGATPVGNPPESATTYWSNMLQSDGRDGRYRRDFSRNMFPGEEHVIRIDADGYLPAKSRVFNVENDNATIDFALEPAAGADYLVLTPDGEPAKSASVGVCTPQLGPDVNGISIIKNSSCELATSGPDGRFSILPQQTQFAVVVLHESGAAYVTGEQLAESKTVKLEPWARVAGTLLIHGKPAANETVSLMRNGNYAQYSPKLIYQLTTTTDDQGNFKFDRVMPGTVLLRRVEDVRIGRMSKSTPTLTAYAECAPGETTNVDLSRDGRPVVAKLVMPKGASEYDWRLAIVNLQVPPKVVPNPPEPPQMNVPWPKGVDPEKDHEAALTFWNEWISTPEGQRQLEENSRNLEAIQKYRPQFISANVKPDGTLQFDDIAAGTYKLSAQMPAMAKGEFAAPGEPIAVLPEYAFTVPEMEGSRSDEPFDLGELKLQPVTLRSLKQTPNGQ